MTPWAPRRATTTSNPAPRLPSGLPPAELGLDLPSARGQARLPLGLVVPEPADGTRLRAAAPGQPRPPAWWSGEARRSGADLVVSRGAVSLNSQVRPLLRAAEAADSRCLVVLAPVVSDEALATLLVNDLAGALPEGILPLRTLVPEPHVDEVLDAVAAYLGIQPWDGRRDSVRLARVAWLHAGLERTRLRLAGEERARGARGLLDRLRRGLGGR